MPRGRPTTRARTTTRRRPAARTATRARGPLTVKVAALNQEVKTITLPSGSTVEDAISSAFAEEVKADRFDPEEGTEEIRMNNRTVDLETRVANNAVITLVADIEGGC